MTFLSAEPCERAALTFMGDYELACMLLAVEPTMVLGDASRASLLRSIEALVDGGRTTLRYMLDHRFSVARDVRVAAGLLSQGGL